MAPKKAATATLTPITSMVELVVSCFDGQLTFLSSNLASCRYFAIEFIGFSI